MYCNYYGFSEKPFDVTPDPRFLYISHEHREALAAIVYGIRERRGFIALTGEVGTGKTMLLNAALDQLESKIHIAIIFNSNVTFVELLNMALFEWGLKKTHSQTTKLEAIQLINDFAIEQLFNGGHVVLIVDEAQNLTSAVLEDLRLLSNLETRQHKLVQILLSGQPELDTKLNRHNLRQLAQRISIKRCLTPLRKRETYKYLKHRLTVADNLDPSLFTPRAKKLIWQYSRGIPRRINVLCDNALLIGFGLQNKRLGPSVIREAIEDLQSSSLPKVQQPSSRHSQTLNYWITANPWLRSPVFVSFLIIFCFLFITTITLDDSAPPKQQFTTIIDPQKIRTTDTKRPDERGSQQQGSLDEPKDSEVVAMAQFASSEPMEQNVKIPRTVMVKKGETLSELIVTTYGRLSDFPIKKILAENPEISNPNRLYAGQIINMPISQNRKEKIVSIDK